MTGVFDHVGHTACINLRLAGAMLQWLFKIHQLNQT